MWFISGKKIIFKNPNWTYIRLINDFSFSEHELYICKYMQSYAIEV